MEIKDELKNNPQLLEEFDEIFDNEEKVSMVLNLKKDSCTRTIKDVLFNELASTEPIKNSRSETYLGLSKSVLELGILSPIHVMVTEGYAEWLEEGQPGVFTESKYLIIDGFRRVYAGLKAGLEGCRAVVWDFKDKDEGSQILTSLSRVLNKTQKHSWNEIWFLHQVLEINYNLSPGTLEYLLQIELGDSMRLKDIMTCDYPEVRDELRAGNKTLMQCYTMLQKLRKEEDMLLHDDATGVSSVDRNNVLGSEMSGLKPPTLTDDEVKEVMDMVSDYDGSLSDDDFDELMGNNVPDERQMVGERHPLDPALKAETLLRDEYKCVCCGRGDGYPIKYALSILNSHHKVSVANGGKDTAENIATLCQVCHTMVHTLLKNYLKFGMSKETFDELPEDTQESLKKIMKLARIDYEVGVRLGKNANDFKEANKNNLKFRMPGADLKDNLDALKQSGVIK
jgi:5-methylcytosine-specific restriction protein A